MELSQEQYDRLAKKEDIKKVGKRFQGMNKKMKQVLEKVELLRKKVDRMSDNGHVCH